MRTSIPAATALLLSAVLSGCVGKESTTTLTPSGPLREMPTANVLGTESAPPGRIRVAHVLVAFQGAESSTAQRSKADAAKLALDLFNAARGGENFDMLMKNSNDPGPGKYGMFTDSKQAKPGDFPRDGMAGAFGDVGFTLKLNEVGLAVFDPVKSPFGWHVIKRIE